VLNRLGAMILIFGLFACGGQGDSSIEEFIDVETSIGEFSVDSPTGSINGVPQMDPYFQEGEFSLSWSVSSSDPYHVKLYLSLNSALSEEDDINFFSQNCGNSNAILNCDSEADFDCRYSPDMGFSCNGEESVDIGSLIEALPQSAYIILEACDGLFESCKTSSIMVNLL
jgi:hypothetical protein